jgi:NAD(P)-dependent dehydrogenase (short-subunit alcohol dehydrogenase family)
VEPAIKATSPIPRIGAEGELKGVCVFLASDASNYITGRRSSSMAAERWR